MGAPKAALMLAGETFLERVKHAAAAAFDRVFVVAREASEIAGSDVIHEPPHGDVAPVFGVLAALRHAQARCVVVAVDFPLLTSDVLAFVRERVESSRAPLVVPVWDATPQMLCAGYDPALVPILEERIGRSRYDLRGLIELAGGELVDETLLRERFSGDPFLNVNTPDELRRAASATEP